MSQRRCSKSHDIARLVIIERSVTRTVAAREGDIGPGDAAWRVFLSIPAWTPAGWLFSGGFEEGGTIERGVFRFDGATIETVIDGSFAFAASSDEVGNAFLLLLDGVTRRLEVLKPDGSRLLVFDSADLLDGLETSIIGFGADAIDEGVVAFTANVRDPNDPAQPAVSVAYRAVISELVPCLGDVNGDGVADPFDLSSWILAFNNNGPACDQNGDGLCSASDFTSWIDNFNDGCP
ncbi:MAG: GC-type dockerin domain-anchored protein [Planctomycetota bacterium]